MNRILSLTLHVRILCTGKSFGFIINLKNQTCFRLILYFLSTSPQDTGMCKNDLFLFCRKAC